MLTIILLALNLYAATGPAELAHARRQVLWNPPKPLTVTDWIWGPGGEARAPLPPFRFVKENLGGTNPKINVSDARGTLWIVKFGGEVHTDTFSVSVPNYRRRFAGRIPLQRRDFGCHREFYSIHAEQNQSTEAPLRSCEVAK